MTVDRCTICLRGFQIFHVEVLSSPEVNRSIKRSLDAHGKLGERRKPLHGDILEAAITEALSSVRPREQSKIHIISMRAERSPVDTPPSGSRAFNNGEFVIYDQHIALRLVVDGEIREETIDR